MIALVQQFTAMEHMIAYNVPEGIMCGFPLMTTPSGEIEIIRDLTLSDNARSRLI